MSRFVGVILAGGFGTRLWPLSRASHPKFLLPLVGDHSLLQNTWKRLADVCDDIYVVTSERHVTSIRSQLPDLGEANLLVEPAERSTMPALTWAALEIEKRAPGSVVASFAADHHIENEELFAATLKTAVELAGSWPLVTVGITPTSPATAYGYVEIATQISQQSFEVARFVEKPKAEIAQEFLDDGVHLWNAGMFFSRAENIIEKVLALHPEIHAAAKELAETGDSSRWLELEPLAIDHALAEPLSVKNEVAIVKAEFEWTDLGDFAALAKLRESDDYLEVNGSGFVLGSKPVAIVGLKNIAVIETQDAILVTALDHAQEVGQVVKKLPPDLR